MKYYKTLALFSLIAATVQGQSFIRSELTTDVNAPWEITYGSDGYLWLTESEGRVSRVNPQDGTKTVVFTASDYFPGSPLEDLPACTNPSIGAGTLGLALDPDFGNPDFSYVYYVYSYNSGTTSSPATKFRIKRLKWDAGLETVVADTNLVDSIPSGHAHLGGRLLAVKQGSTSHLFLSIGDHGPSEMSAPSCYDPQSENPNNYTQDINTKNGKIHRFNMDGSIPVDNPVTGNSFFTRGHRNPQGLMYNPGNGHIYDIEHGDHTDDEINVLYPGMNYGWKQVRGYHDDASFPGEADYVANYVANPAVANDSLVEAFYSWCTVADTSSENFDWCTVAPSGGTYYDSEAIPGWFNSLLVVTLKDGLSTDRELYQLKLTPDGSAVAPSTTGNPNPKKFFGEDQALNGRLRDIAISPDGMRIYLVNNGGTDTDKITVYTYDTTNTGIGENPIASEIKLYPNPVKNQLILENLDLISEFIKIEITSLSGRSIQREIAPLNSIDVSGLANGVYLLNVYGEDEIHTLKFIKRE